MGHAQDSMLCPRERRDAGVQDTIRDMKAKLEELSETPANLQRLVFRGHVLKDEQLLSHHSEFPPT